MNSPINLVNFMVLACVMKMKNRFKSWLVCTSCMYLVARLAISGFPGDNFINDVYRTQAGIPVLHVITAMHSRRLQGFFQRTGGIKIGVPCRPLSRSGRERRVKRKP